MLTSHCSLKNGQTMSVLFAGRATPHSAAAVPPAAADEGSARASPGAASASASSAGNIYPFTLPAISG